MNVELLNNRKTDFVNKIKELVIDSDEIRCAVSFIRESGLSLIEDVLKKSVEKNKKVFVLFGEDFKTTQSGALRKLKNDLNINIRVFKPKKGIYHPKFWVFQKSKKITIVIGSSNISESAFKKNIEVNLCIDGTKEEQILKETLEYFESLWYGEESYEIDEDYLENYEKHEAELKPKIEEISKLDERYKKEIKPQIKSLPNEIVIRLNEPLRRDDIPSWKKSRLILIPRQYRLFFPSYKEEFIISTDVGEIKTWMVGTSAKEGDKIRGTYFTKNMKKWYEKHSELKIGDKLIIKKVKPLYYTLEIE
ncbi:MAG: hypothetical protein KKA62_04325 [Nanoarchaeota archaeon]|nr:hypothetical protein [Nanoarchaeota archaeon]MBU1977146.1 hypothetical protein [Nanoarchaeota archaeon]